MKPFLELQASKALTHIAQSIQQSNFKNKTQTFQCSAMGLTLDYSRQQVHAEILELLIELVLERNVHEAISGLTSGKKINIGQDIPALHTALRIFDPQSIWIDDQDIMEQIHATREQMQQIATALREGAWLGYSNKKIKDIVHIGIGGSDLGPRFCIQALKPFSTEELGFHFISDADPEAFQHTVAQLNPETTLFILASKSFTTTETLYNAKKAFQWINQKQFAHRHFIAITANKMKAQAYGIEHVLEIGEWVGGRYSLCSAVNLITAIAIGFDAFCQLLRGAQAMDEHFKTMPPDKNLPMLLALLGVWNNNFLHIHNVLMLVYLQQLEQFVPYIQQLDMESNGKFIDKQGRKVNYSTGPIIWGGLGNRAQHSYYQLLCQGTHRVTADLLSVDAYENELINEMCRKKIHTLSQGVSDPLQPHGTIPGGIPLNHLRLTSCKPETIGSLCALYEHKIFIQSVLWDINPFDQPGVDSSKKHPAPAIPV